jgi:menaquinone-specific isochorismate synthase
MAYVEKALRHGGYPANPASLNHMSHTPDTITNVPTLHVVTRSLKNPGVLTEWISPRNPLVFMRRGHGLVGRGPSITTSFTGQNRIHQASAWWSEVVKNAHIDDTVDTSGSGLVAFGAMTFSDSSREASVLVIPRTIIGVSGAGAWRTDITVHGDTDKTATDSNDNTTTDVSTDTTAIHALTPTPPTPLSPVSWQTGLVSEDDFLGMVKKTLDHLSLGHADKVVLARDLVARSPYGADWRQAIQRLSDRYPDTHTFAIDGLVGASPETLVSLHNNTLRTRVLAGSRARGGSERADQQAADDLYRSSKDLDEHRFAVHSVVEALKSLTRHVAADDVPFTLKLPNLWHLATDIAATLPDGKTGLDAVAALHPTAAVAGSPTTQALEIINTLEPFDRGRYAGPVGWVDHRGDGEWAIALRCAQWSEDGTITAHAGAGIVPGSDPESELLETGLKFQPIIDAFSER